MRDRYQSAALNKYANKFKQVLSELGSDRPQVFEVQISPDLISDKRCKVSVGQMGNESLTNCHGLKILAADGSFSDLFFPDFADFPDDFVDFVKCHVGKAVFFRRLSHVFNRGCGF